MITDFYRFTIPKFVNSTNIVFKIINGITVKEYQLVNALCDRYVKKRYPKCKKQLNSEPREKKIIVSFTTIPSRITNIPYVLRSLYNQTMMPDRITLWITNEISEVQRKEICGLLKSEIDFGLEINYIRDVRVHTKYYYAMLKNPEDIIITVDDDMIYPETLIENLYKAHQENPDCVIASRTHELTFSGKDIRLYDEWHRLAPGANNKGHSLLATGVGGVLYPPHCLFEDWEKSELFLELCPTADDIWLKIMEAMNGTKVVKLYKYTKETFTFSDTQSVALVNLNVGQGRNDILLKQCQQHYDFNSELFIKS